MEIDLADVTLHIDETMDDAGRAKLEDALRQRDGVVSVSINAEHQHLMVVEYNPKAVRSQDLVDIAKFQGLHGELVGL